MEDLSKDLSKIIQCETTFTQSDSQTIEIR
jgi:hypothetical protein